MKKCSKCETEIINGENGCMLLDVCFTCHGGYPQYYAPVKIYVNKEADYESKCIRDNFNE